MASCELKKPCLQIEITEKLFLKKGNFYPFCLAVCWLGKIKRINYDLRRVTVVIVKAKPQKNKIREMIES